MASETHDARNVRDPLPVADIPIVAYDYGINTISCAGCGSGLGSRGASDYAGREALMQTCRHLLSGR